MSHLMCHTRDMNTATTAKFRYIGITDEQTQCDKCSRTELRSTVLLAELDADGNVAEVLHYGSSCAARALSARYGVKVTKAQVMNAAASAETERRNADRFARELLTHMGLPLTGPATEAQLAAAEPVYMAANPRVQGSPRAAVLDMLARRQAHVIADVA